MLLLEEEQKDARVLAPNPSIVVRSLNNKKDFLLLKHQGQKKISPFFIAQWIVSNDKPNHWANTPDCLSSSVINVGYIVTKKIGSSVMRNRIKRRLREALRLSLKNIGFQSLSSFVAQFVFIARKNILFCSFMDLQKTVEDSIRLSCHAMDM